MRKSNPITQKPDEKIGFANVSDIEELCGICAPIPGSTTVESFPMRAERKKAREETDVVRVVEWRANPTSQERWFVLVRRPDGGLRLGSAFLCLFSTTFVGLLGGLEEFPTVPVEDDEAEDSEIDNTLTHMRDLILDDVAPPTTVPKSSNHKTSPAETSNPTSSPLLRVTRVKEADDVLHIFSHIRKTYRVRWVLLEGGSDAPPQLRPRSTPADPDRSTKKKGKSTTKPAKKGSKKAKTTVETIDVDADLNENLDGLALHANGGIRWVPLKDVADAK
jgi:A/G-specific adenine glycosylase